MLKIKQDLFYEPYHLGIKNTIALLSQNQITRIRQRSQLEEAVRFLNSFNLLKNRIFFMSKLLRWV